MPLNALKPAGPPPKFKDGKHADLEHTFTVMMMKSTTMPALMSLIVLLDALKFMLLWMILALPLLQFQLFGVDTLITLPLFLTKQPVLEDLHQAPLWLPLLPSLLLLLPWFLIIGIL
ncbi:hypothetical protein KCQ_05756 [Pectobacterium atrosepticum ICMP 1526]|nr:hypothetical protein KCQ_05756 [Pectobacterium atrosepticum ICMP 1526]